MPEPGDAVTTLSATVTVSLTDNPIEAGLKAYDALREKVAAGRYAFAHGSYDLALEEDRSDFFVRDKIKLTATAKVLPLDRVMGAVDGPPGPFSPAHRTTPHVFAREVYSGSGNCRCGAALGDDIHTEAAPGVPIPKEMRRG